MAYKIVLVMAVLSVLASLGFLARPSPYLQSASSTPRNLLRVDPTFFETSAVTGGDFYFWSPGEFARSTVEIPLGGEDLLLAHGELAGARGFEFPVDTLLSRVEVFVGAQELEEVLLTRPDGTRVADGAGVHVQTFEHMRIVRLEHPVAGTWGLEVAGRGLACVTVRGGTLPGAIPEESALSPILFVDFTFVEPGGRPGHEGWFPLEREARAGEELTVRVDLAGSFARAELGFVRGDATPLDAPFVELELEPDGETAYASVTVPREPYRPVVRGFDVSGAAFRRLDSPLFTPAKNP